MQREREILVVYASLARKSFHLWKNFNFSRKNRVFECNSIQDIKNKEKKKKKKKKKVITSFILEQISIVYFLYIAETRSL